jgi:hypothetical protein
LMNVTPWPMKHDAYAVADKGVALDFAAFADVRAALDFDERTDLGIVADRAAVEIDVAEDADVFAELDVGGDADEVFAVVGRVALGMGHSISPDVWLLVRARSGRYYREDAKSLERTAALLREGFYAMMWP